MKTLAAFFVITALTLAAAESAKVRKLSVDPSTGLENARRHAVYQSGLEFIVPQLIIGGEWTSTIKLTNKGQTPIPWSNVYFVDNTGNLMLATFRTVPGGNIVTDMGFSFRLPDNGILEVTFYGGDEAKFGHALMDPDACPLEADCTLYGEVTLKNSHPSRPDFESVFPLENASDLQYILWDHRGGFYSTLYLVSANSTANLVELQFRDSTDQSVYSVTLRMESGEARILTPHAMAPATIGKQGTLVIRSTNVQGGYPLVVATALRINPSNSFTPVRAFAPK